MLKIEEIAELLHYDPETGILRWRARTPDMFMGRTYPKEREAKRWNERYEGTVAGTRCARGYVAVSLFKKSYKAHRIAWALVHKSWPSAIIDHADGNPSNNSIANLRLANPMQNCANCRRRKDNRSGKKGVVWNKRDAVWFADIRVAGRRIHLGTFKTRECAAAAYAEAAHKYFGEFARTE